MLPLMSEGGVKECRGSLQKCKISVLGGVRGEFPCVAKRELPLDELQASFQQVCKRFYARVKLGPVTNC